MTTASIDRRSLLTLLLGATAGVLSPATQTVRFAAAGDEVSLEDGDPVREGNYQLQAIGALGVGHIQSTLGLIGVIADSLTKEIYSLKQVEDLMNGTVNGMEVPKRILRRLQESNISSDDAEFLDRMIGVLNALQREAKALVAFSKSRKADDAQQFERARKIVLKKLAELTHQDELAQPNTTTSASPPAKTR